MKTAKTEESFQRLTARTDIDISIWHILATHGPVYWFLAGP